MKRKLTITVDEDLIPVAKRHAKAQGLSLSEFIERRLRGACEDGESKTFSQRWQGTMKPAKKAGPRYARLAKKHL